MAVVAAVLGTIVLDPSAAAGDEGEDVLGCAVHYFEDVGVIVGYGDVAGDPIAQFAAVVQPNGEGVADLEFAEVVEDAGDGVATLGDPVDVAGEDGVVVLAGGGGEGVPGHEVRAVRDLRVVLGVQPHGLHGGVYGYAGYGDAGWVGRWWRADGGGGLGEVGVAGFILGDDLFQAALGGEVDVVIAEGGEDAEQAQPQKDGGGEEDDGAEAEASIQVGKSR